MVATNAAPERGRSTTVIQLRTALFEELCKRRGAINHTQRAELVGVERGHLYRLKRRDVTASLQVAKRIADRLGTTVDELFEQVTR